MAKDGEIELVIDHVGARGDGIAQWQGRPIYVPLTAPGDRVRVQLGPRRGEGQSAELVTLIAPGARAEPICPHFGRCGGCALQHLAPDAYAAMKEAQIAAALRQHGVVADDTLPLRRVAPGTRRRARLSVRRLRNGAEIGFNARQTHAITDMQSCAVLHPAIVAVIEPLRRMAPALWPGGAASATVTLGDTGLDVLLDRAAAPDLATLEALAQFADAQDLARLMWRIGTAEPVPATVRRPPRVVFSGVAVALPPDAFLQASREAEAILVAEVQAGIDSARRVADLYAGLGTFSFALAQSARVHAVEGAPSAVAALAGAASGAQLGGRITAERRDLDANPLLADDLARFDAVVFDPPRAGAKAQSAALAASRVPRIVAVSCNPASFARDARALIDGGYRLRRVQPIDQFLWSPHVELVAHFTR